MLLLISLLPPPLTVLGLWQNVPSPRVPISRQLGAPGCFSIRTLNPDGVMYVLPGRSGIDRSTPSLVHRTRPLLIVAWASSGM